MKTLRAVLFLVTALAFAAAGREERRKRPPQKPVQAPHEHRSPAQRQERPVQKNRRQQWKAPQAPAQRETGREPPQQRAMQQQKPGAYQVPGGPSPRRLGAEESHSVIGQLNASRAGMRGINAAPLPHGDVTVRQNGGLHIQNADGRSYGVRPNGTIASYSAPGRSAKFRPDGSLASFRSNDGLRISRSPGGARVVARQAQGTTVVSQGPHAGYVQRNVVVQNNVYVQRTYVVNQLVYTRVYRPYAYGGIVLNVYAPVRYYSPAYYGWCYSPWPLPVAYGWGWRVSPWYGYYGVYFRPLPVYPAPWWWLGDYILAEQLRESYEAGRAAQAAADAAAAPPPPESSAAPVTPQVRAAIAEEVQRQLAEEREEAAAYKLPPPPPPGTPAAEDAASAPAPTGSATPAPDTPKFLKPPGRVYVVSSDVDVIVEQEPCSLSAGDVLRLEASPPPGEVAATVRVLSSKGQDCGAGSIATLSIDDLQEMSNGLREKLDAGLGQLQSVQSTGEVPAAPPAGTIEGPGAVAAAPAENSVVLLAQTQRDADAAEAELEREMRVSE